MEGTGGLQKEDSQKRVGEVLLRRDQDSPRAIWGSHSRLLSLMASSLPLGANSEGRARSGHANEHPGTWPLLTLVPRIGHFG